MKYLLIRAGDDDRSLQQVSKLVELYLTREVRLKKRGPVGNQKVIQLDMFRERQRLHNENCYEFITICLTYLSELIGSYKSCQACAYRDLQVKASALMDFILDNYMKETFKCCNKAFGAEVQITDIAAVPGLHKIWSALNKKEDV